MVTPLATHAALAVLVLISAGCGNTEADEPKGDQRKAGDVVEREDNPPIHYVKDDDPKMVAAINKARDTVGQFIDANNKPTEAQTGFSVKVALSDSDGEHTEHMWIGPVTYADGKLTGPLGNVPNDLKEFKLGDKITKAKEEISDWMYIDDGKLVGGYTIRLLRDGMTADERAQFDASVPFKFE